jgi:hypothetical protein
MSALVTSNPYESVTYCNVDEPLTPDDIVFIVHSRRAWNRLHVLKESSLGLVEEGSHIYER